MVNHDVVRLLHFDCFVAHCRKSCGQTSRKSTKNDGKKARTAAWVNDSATVSITISDDEDSLPTGYYSSCMVNKRHGRIHGVVAYGVLVYSVWMEIYHQNLQYMGCKPGRKL
jgi:hypothetical protein